MKNIRTAGLRTAGLIALFVSGLAGCQANLAPVISEQAVGETAGAASAESSRIRRFGRAVNPSSFL